MLTKLLEILVASGLIIFHASQLLFMLQRFSVAISEETFKEWKSKLNDFLLSMQEADSSASDMEDLWNRIEKVHLLEKTQDGDSEDSQKEEGEGEDHDKEPIEESTTTAVAVEAA